MFRRRQTKTVSNTRIAKLKQNKPKKIEFRVSFPHNLRHSVVQILYNNIASPLHISNSSYTPPAFVLACYDSLLSPTHRPIPFNRRTMLYVCII